MNLLILHNGWSGFGVIVGVEVVLSIILGEISLDSGVFVVVFPSVVVVMVVLMGADVVLGSGLESVTEIAAADKCSKVLFSRGGVNLNRIIKSEVILSLETLAKIWY